MTNEAAKAAAIQTLLESGICSLPVTDTQIISMINKSGFSVISFGYPLTESDRADFKALRLTETAEKYSAFTYCGHDVKYVFIRNDLSFTERKKALAHELGHIRLMHIKQKSCFCNTDFKSRHPQETEANAYALELLCPTCILRRLWFLSPSRIARLTQVDNSTAEHIFCNVRRSRFRRLTDAEKRLCKSFSLRRKS